MVTITRYWVRTKPVSRSPFVKDLLCQIICKLVKYIQVYTRSNCTFIIVSFNLEMKMNLNWATLENIYNILQRMILLPIIFSNASYYTPQYTIQSKRNCICRFHTLNLPVMRQIISKEIVSTSEIIRTPILQKWANPAIVYSDIFVLLLSDRSAPLHANTHDWYGTDYQR